MGLFRVRNSYVGFYFRESEVVFPSCHHVFLLYTYSVHRAQAQSRAVPFIPICYVMGGCAGHISTFLRGTIVYFRRVIIEVSSFQQV